MTYLTVILFLLGFAMLIKGADLLVNGASAIARRYHVSDLVIGLTVVAFGTSTPELFVNIAASLEGSPEIAIGNILGSNIANILLILGVSAIIRPLIVTKGTVWKEIPFSLLAAVVVALMANDRLISNQTASGLTRADGGVLLCFFIVFLYYSYGIAAEIEGMEKPVKDEPPALPRAALYVLSGLAGLAIGGKWIVDGAIWVAGWLGMSQSLIGLTIVAVGTSLPELATSAMAAYRGNAEIAVGNVVGSNIFNIFFILGVSSVIKPLPFQPASNIDIILVVSASLLLFAFMFSGKRRSLDRWEGIIFLCLYTAYIGYLITTSLRG